MEQKILLDKYRPYDFNDIHHNKEVLTQLQKLTKQKSIPHMILYGPSQCGKKTFVNLFLKEKYGNSVFNLKKMSIELQTSNNVIFNYFVSKYHFYVSMKDYNVYDRAIIQSLIKDISRTKNILSDYHIIVIDKAEKLNIDAQQSLLRTMEKHMNNCRFILLVNSEYNLIEPLSSRCIHLHLKQPTSNELELILNNIQEHDKTQLKQDIIKKIPYLCDYKISSVINFFEFLTTRYPNVSNNDIQTLYYEFDTIKRVVNELTKELFEKNDIQFLYEANETINDLIIHSTDPNNVMKQLFCEILLFVNDDKTAKEIILLTDESYNNLTYHNKPIYHLMDYYIKCFHCIKNKK